MSGFLENGLLIAFALIFLMIILGVYLGFVLYVSYKDNVKLSFKNLYFLLPLIAFILCTIGAVFALVFSGGAPEQPKPDSPQTSNSVMSSAEFENGTNELIAPLIYGDIERDEAFAKIDELAKKHLSSADNEAVSLAAARVDAALAVKEYIEAAEFGDYLKLDKAVRFYGEDYAENSLNYPDDASYYVFNYLCENGTLTKNDEIKSIINGSIDSYIDYCENSNATHTRLTIMTDIYPMLKALGFENSDAKIVSQKANKILKLIADGELVVEASEIQP